MTARVILTLASVVALGLIATISVFWWSENRVREQRMDADLSQEVAQLRTLAGAIDPATGQNFGSVSSLLGTYLTRNVPGQNEGFLVLIDGEVPFLPPWDQRLPLERVPELVDAARQVGPTDNPRYADLETEEASLRYVAVPVSVEGDPAHGVFVVAVDLEAEEAQNAPARQAQVFIAIGTVLAISLLAAWALSRLLRPLSTLASTAERITEEDLSERIPEPGADDLARLTRTVNGMLDRLEVAFEGQRALLDDVGHELRTPLTVIRGHLEVVDPEDPQDVRETATLVINETDRMSRLVEELVLLAKSMRPDFLVVAPVEMDALVSDLYDRAVALGERRWRIDAFSGAVVEGDAQRLIQAGLQLVSNAVAHTEPGDEIGVGSTIEGDIVRLTVRDTGTGIPKDEQERIFDRAVRGTGGVASSAAPSDTLSSGLGLSIVSAIARAHGGDVDLVSTYGTGAVFAIELPLAPADGQDDEETP